MDGKYLWQRVATCRLQKVRSCLVSKRELKPRRDYVAGGFFSALRRAYTAHRGLEATALTSGFHCMTHALLTTYHQSCTVSSTPGSSCAIKKLKSSITARPFCMARPTHLLWEADEQKRTHLHASQFQPTGEFFYTQTTTNQSWMPRVNGHKQQQQREPKNNYKCAKIKHQVQERQKVRRRAYLHMRCVPYKSENHIQSRNCYGCYTWIRYGKC